MSGVYYATVMVLTTAATVTGVMILSIHHKVRQNKSEPQLDIPPLSRAERGSPSQLISEK